MHAFIYSTLRYPVAAVEANIEGTVLVAYDINHKGVVIDTKVLQSLGHGCDEEACRVVRMLQFEVGKNRGVQVVFHQKITIHFKKPVAVAVPPPPTATGQMQLTYTVVTTSVPAATPTEKNAGSEVYTYTISTGTPNNDSN
jgi:TonB family protein